MPQKIASLVMDRGFAPAVLAFDGSEPVRRIQLLPMGKIVPRDGRAPWHLRDLDHANRVIEATRATLGALDMPGDYDHQLMFGAKDGVGGKAPASGWVKPQTLTAQADGIWGEVEWTQAAEAALKAKEYRYLSPVFGFDKDTRDVTRLCNFALTNDPALDNLAAVAAFQEQDDDMSLTAIAAALGLAAEADEPAILAAITARNEERAATAQALGLKDDATGEEIAAAAKAKPAAGGEPDPTKWVPKTMFDELRQDVAALKNESTEDKAAAAVERALEEGKLTPAQKDWALAYAKKDLKGFTDEFLATAAVVVKPGEAGRKGAPASADVTTLTEDEKAACKLQGISEEDFLKSKKELLS